MKKYFYHIVQKINYQFNNFNKNNIEVLATIFTVFGIVFGYKYNIGIYYSLLFLCFNLIFVYLTKNFPNIKKIALCFVFLFGFNFYTILYNDIKQQNYYEIQHNGKYFVYGEIEKIYYSNGYKALLNNVQIENEKINSKILLKINSELKIGDIIGVHSYLFKPVDNVIEDGFNYKQYLYHNNISANGYAIDDIVIINTKPNVVQNEIKQIINNNFSQKNGAIINALMLGDKSNIEKKDYQKIIDLGLAHILAISGMHIGFLMGFSFLLFRFFIVAVFGSKTYGINVKNISIILALFVAGTYVYISQFQISAIRSFLMAVVFVFGILMGRKTISFSKVFVIFLLMLLYNPFYLFNISFQLSFIAVVILVLYFENISQQQTVVNYFKNIIKTSIIITVFMFPIITHYWGGAQILGVITNVVVIPLVGFVILPLSFLSIIINLIGFEFGFYYIVNIGLDFLYWFINVFNNFDYKTFDIPYINSTLLFVMYVLMFVFFKYNFVGKFKYVMGILSLLFLLYPMFSQNNKSQILVNFNNYIVIDDKKNIYTNIKNSNNFLLKEYKKIYGFGKTIVKFKNSKNCINNVVCEFKINNKKIYVYNSIKNLKNIENICENYDILIIPKIIIKNCNASVIDKTVMYWYKNYIYLL